MIHVRSQRDGLRDVDANWNEVLDFVKKKDGMQRRVRCIECKFIREYSPRQTRMELAPKCNTSKDGAIVTYRYEATDYCRY